MPSARPRTAWLLALVLPTLVPACKRPAPSPDPVGSSSSPASSGSPGSPGAPSSKTRVAVSIFPLFDIARRVGGDRLEVVLVLPPGRSEHDYDPSPRELARVADARLGLSVGLGMDGWLEKIVRGAAGPSVPIVQLGPQAKPRAISHEDVGEEAADEARKKAGGKGEHHDGHDDHDDDKGEHGKGEHHEHGPLDPHFWLDPVRMKGAADQMAEAFARVDPAGKESFVARSGEVKASLEALHSSIDGRSKTWSKKTIVTFHGSMGYYAERYGLTVAAVLEPFPGKEPTAKYLTEVLAAIKKSQAAALFSEPQLDPKPARVVADQAKIPLFELDPVGGGKGAETYEALLTRDTDVLEKALK